MRIAFVGSIALLSCDDDAEIDALSFFEFWLCDREARVAIGVMLDMLEAGKLWDKSIANRKGGLGPPTITAEGLVRAALDRCNAVAPKYALLRKK
jgi:hypothetical protein